MPGYLRLFDLVNALVTPEWGLRLVRRVLDDARALTSIDHDARRDYEQRVADQAVVRELRAAEEENRPALVGGSGATRTPGRPRPWPAGV